MRLCIDYRKTRSSSVIIISHHALMITKFNPRVRSTFPRLNCDLIVISYERRCRTYPRLPLTHVMVFIKLTSPESIEKHENYLRTIIPILRQGKLYAMSPKCKFPAEQNVIPKSRYSKQKELYEPESERIS